MHLCVWRDVDCDKFEGEKNSSEEKRKWKKVEVERLERILKFFVLCGTVLITRAHSFLRPAGFRAEPRNLGFSAELGRGSCFSTEIRGIWRFSFEQLFFHRK